MFKKISSSQPFPTWATEGTRWRTLGVLDSLLDGTFYNHLPYCFYDESDSQGRYIPISQRRPSCQFRLARYVARWASRKLFVGRHIPKVRAGTPAEEEKIQEVLNGSQLWATMYDAAYRGTVGAVAVTFCIDKSRIGFKVWRAQWCSPIFDDFGELVCLRVHYVTTPSQLAAMELPVTDPNGNYWFIRDYLPTQEITYQPVSEQDWNPVQGFVRGEGTLRPSDKIVNHNLGFVPGVWIANPGGSLPDGPALWEDGIPNAIEADYLMSQSARGSRYSCAPQLVTKGQILNAPEGSAMNPTTTLMFAADRKTAEGDTIAGGDAKLIEMEGSGMEVALKIVEALKKMAMEQIGVIQKDPGEMKGPLSGRAMEYLDEDAHDTAMQWRSRYGENGALKLLAKVLQAQGLDIDVTKLWLQWPRIYQPTPADLQSIAQALKIAITPTVPEGAKPGEDGSIPTLAPLMDMEVARAYWEANLDLGIIDDTQSVETGIEGKPADPKAVPPEDGGPIQKIGQFWTIHPAINIPGE